MLGCCDSIPSFIRTIAPYLPGKPVSELAREMGLNPQHIVKLASNENPSGPSPKALEAIQAALPEITRYPDGNAFDLKAALHKRFSIPTESILLGNGSNEILEMIAQVFLRPGDEAIYSQHAFAVYPLAVQARGATGIEVPAKNYGHDLEGMLTAITQHTKVIFVANPNNPTGTWHTHEAIEAFLHSVPSRIIVVLDEAYEEYLNDTQRSPSLHWYERFPNLIITRTFSKAYGLAGLRVGYGVMHPEIAGWINRIRIPFNVSLLAQIAAIAALDDEVYLTHSRKLNQEGYAQLTQGIIGLSRTLIPSFGNFFCVEVGDAKAVNQGLLHQGIIVRPVANYGLPNHLRVSVGTHDENQRFLDALKVALQ